MIYNLTDKIKIEDDPKIKIKEKTITVKSDAETVLELLSVLQEKGETVATVEAFSLLFSEKDQKIIRSLKLSFQNYTKLLETAVSLALGEDPDAQGE